MIEQFSLQTVLTYLTLISVPVGVFYHILTLRNTRKNQELQLETRQAQLFMQIYNQWSTMEMGRLYEKVMDSELVYEDWNSYDIDSRVGFRKVSRFFEGVGVLVKRGLIDASLVDDLISGATIRHWDHIQPFVIDFRKDRNWPQYGEWAEYLYNKIKQITDEQHPELKT